MSAILGIYNLDGKPVSEELARWQMKAVAHYGHDDSGSWQTGNITLGHQMTYITPEDKFDKLPYTSPDGRYVITADARIDNREELFAIFGTPHDERMIIPDSHLILAAYLKWGEECPVHLLGDFAFAIWDQHEHSLFFARDHLGIRPFYYHHSSRLFVFASDIRGVIFHPDVPDDLNEKTIGWYLSSIDYANINTTFLLAVNKLPQAHTLIITPEKYQLNRYWHPADCPEVSMPSVEAYSQKLTELLELAVSARMRTAFPVGSHLSGGVDSSIITALVAREYRKKGERLTTYSWMPPPDHTEDNIGSEYLCTKALCQAEDLLHVYVEPTTKDMVAFLNQDIALDPSTNLVYEPFVRQLAAQNNVRTLFTGWGGDELISDHAIGYYAELFWKGKWGKLSKTLYERQQVLTGKTPLQSPKWLLGTLYRRVFLASLPDNLYMLLDRNWGSPKNMSCTTPEFRDLIYKNKLAPGTLLRQRIGQHANQIKWLENGHLAQRIEGWNSGGAWDRITYVHPLLDMRIVEFSLGIPSELYLHDGYARFLFLNAAKRLLPQDVDWHRKHSEANRVNRLLDATIEAERLWLAQKDTQIKLARQHPLIDTSTLSQLQYNGNRIEEKINHVFTLLFSIQVHCAGEQVKTLRNSKP